MSALAHPRDVLRDHVLVKPCPRAMQEFYHARIWMSSAVTYTE